MTGDDLKPPTKAQRELLAWLVEGGHTTGVRGGHIIPLYAERRRHKLLAEGTEPKLVEAMRETGGSGRTHAWRRTGGKALAEMERRGLVVKVRIDWGTAEYNLTERGLAVGREQIEKARSKEGTTDGK